jgi:hypothetical protein
MSARLGQEAVTAHRSCIQQWTYSMCRYWTQGVSVPLNIAPLDRLSENWMVSHDVERVSRLTYRWG